MGQHAKTLKIITEAQGILTATNPMTVRQVYYQLVSRQVVENNRGQYQAVSNALVDARKSGAIPWEWIEDRLRRPRRVSMWRDLAHFADVLRRSYRRDVWATQSSYTEVWLEKDALSGLFSDVLNKYGITLNVGRGYDGWDSIHNAADRYGAGHHVSVLYFGDFDPSGEDMVRSLRDRLAFFECTATITKCAITAADVKRYELPPNFTKSTDTRQAGFVSVHGDVAVELDALPVDVLMDRLRYEVEARMDLAALAEVQEVESREREKLVAVLQEIK
ncbi:MAG: hypothetical protein ABIZ80_13130 [Bryobacteraceae bacterium]